MIIPSITGIFLSGQFGGADYGCVKLETTGGLGFKVFSMILQPNREYEATSLRASQSGTRLVAADDTPRL